MAASALSRLRQHGSGSIVATNQPDIARKRLTRAHVDCHERASAQQAAVDAVEVCPHDERKTAVPQAEAGIVAERGRSAMDIALDGASWWATGFAISGRATAPGCHHFDRRWL